MAQIGQVLCDGNGAIISEVYDSIEESTEEGLYIVEKNGNVSYIDESGKRIYPGDFWRIKQDFQDGIAIVIKNNYVEKYITTTGKIIRTNANWKLGQFINGMAKVRRDRKVNYVNKEGKLVSEKWFDAGSSFNRFGTVVVILNGKENLLNKEGNFVLNKWYAQVLDEGEYVQVYDNGINYIRKKDNKLMLGPNIEDIIKGVGYSSLVKYKQRNYQKTKVYNLLSESYTELFKVWYDEITYITTKGVYGKDISYFIVGKYSKAKDKMEYNRKIYNVITSEGNLVSKKWFDGIFEEDGLVKVYRDAKPYYLELKTGEITPKG